MIDKARIAAEAEHFFEWPDQTNRNFVTLTSCLIFAGCIAEMVRKEKLDQLRHVIAELEVVDDDTVQAQCLTLREMLEGEQ